LGELFEEPPGSIVVARNARLDVGDLAAGIGLKQGLNHATRKPLAAGFGGNNHLPDEEDFRTVRNPVTGDKAQHVVAVGIFSDHRSRGKVRAL